MSQAIKVGLLGCGTVGTGILRLLAENRDDIVARLGGVEFVVVASDVSNPAAARVIGRKMLDAIREPFELADRQQVRIGATIGLAMAPDDGRKADVLLRAADEAMYAGKTAGRQCLRQAGQHVQGDPDVQGGQAAAAGQDGQAGPAGQPGQARELVST